MVNLESENDDAHVLYMYCTGFRGLKVDLIATNPPNSTY